MKRLGLFLLCAVLPPLSAADLTLQDGRVLKDYRVVGESPTTLTLRYDGGLAKVMKSELPATLRARHPIDHERAAEEARAIEEGREVYETQVRAVAEIRRQRAEAEAQAEAARVTAAGDEGEADVASRQITRAQARWNTPRTFSAETASLVLPAVRQTYSVQYEVVGDILGVEVRHGENGQHSQLRNVDARQGWRQPARPLSGDRLYLWAKGRSAGGGEFRVRILVDGAVVREASARGGDTEAEISYTLP